LVPVHFALISCLVILGFIILDCVLITIGQWGAGIAGIVLLGGCAVWIKVYWVVERQWGYFPTARDIEVGRDFAWSDSGSQGK